MSIPLAAAKSSVVQVNGVTVETNNAYCLTTLNVDFIKETMACTFTRGSVNGNGVLTPGVLEPGGFTIQVNLGSLSPNVPGFVVSSDGNSFTLTGPQLTGAQTTYIGWWNQMEQFIVAQVLALGLVASPMSGATQTPVTTAAIS
jgi:hypothetical protein